MVLECLRLIQTTLDCPLDSVMKLCGAQETFPRLVPCLMAYMGLRDDDLWEAEVGARLRLPERPAYVWLTGAWLVVTWGSMNPTPLWRERMICIACLCGMWLWTYSSKWRRWVICGLPQ
jgi:hypothetical protein